MQIKYPGILFERNRSKTQIFVEKSRSPRNFNESLVKRKMVKNQKIVFTHVSEHCASFRTKNLILSLVDGGGVHMSFSRKYPITLSAEPQKKNVIKMRTPSKNNAIKKRTPSKRERHQKENAIKNRTPSKRERHQ